MKMIDYACQRFGGGASQVRVHSDAATTLERSIVIDGRGQYSRVGCH
jgi:hypothetical protein